ncbi:alanine racemase [Alkalicoccus halolimnae]|uniref:Alanine racemase n=1 Tax=Alkalicoccus halolimnae TaxID=1667239 RepID=A0A5C7F5K1_9BACI|nr:alanine racemase [Alkalicoccus halolimnae]TXF83965.1 alanine racemase [Alkalicoccus halolimnae]
MNQRENVKTTALFYRDTWAEVDLSAIKNNLAGIKKQLEDGIEVMAVVKADGYGHGARETAETALEAGASYLGTALLDEAVALRRNGIEAPILVLGVTRPEDAVVAAEYGITLTVFQADWVKKAEVFLASSLKQVSCHVKLDSGMNRIGMKQEAEIEVFAEVVKACRFLDITGAYTHLATADELDPTYTDEQLERFKNMADLLEAELGKKIPCRHSANSAGAMLHRKAGFNMARIGISMYGLAPSPAVKPVLPVRLQEAFSLHSQLTHVKQLHKGETVSYGRTYTAEEEEWIGTVPIGYADGWIRANQSGDVLVNGRRAQIVGRICMDQMMVKLPGYTEPGTKVTLIGRQGEAYIPVDEVAERLGTINYEIPCIISFRVPRVVKRAGEITAVHNRALD